MQHVRISSLLIGLFIGFAVAMTLTLFYHKMNVVNQIKFIKHHDEAGCGFGGGVTIDRSGRRHFVTMIQQEMFLLDKNHYIPMLNTTKRVWIDVGSHATSFLGDAKINRRTYWPNHSFKTLSDEFKFSEDLFVIAIDPNVKVHADLSKIPRLISIIAAIFSTEGTQLFYEYGGEGCSSLLKPNRNFDHAFSSYTWFKPCTEVKETTGTSTIRLESIISLINPRYEIELLKIDAQGVDLEVVKSAGKHLKRIRKIILETQDEVMKNGSSNILYKDANTAKLTKEWMEDNGYVFNKEQSDIENESISEYNHVYDRSDSIHET